MPPWFPEVKDVVLLVIAVWGAALSTFNWWTGRLKERRNIRLKLSTYTPVFQNGTLGQRYVRVTAVNAGHRAVKIDHLALALKERSVGPRIAE